MDNPYASMVRTQIAQLSENDALALLKSATFPPRVEDADMWFGTNNAHMKLFAPDKPDKFSHASANTVRRIAEHFFPQYPSLASPHCTIYLDMGEVDPDMFASEDEAVEIYTLHSHTLEAFKTDSAALQYLLRVHKDPSVQRGTVTPEIKDLLASTDAEWTIYDDMGIAPEEAYRISKSLVVPTSALPLPAEFHI